MAQLLTQAESAERIGSTQVEVSRWESGEARRLRCSAINRPRQWGC